MHSHAGAWEREIEIKIKSKSDIMIMDFKSAIEAMGMRLESEDPLTVAPENMEQFSRLFKLAGEKGWKLNLRGRGTQSDFPQGRLLVSTSALNKVDQTFREDLLLVAGGGLAYGELQKAISEFGISLSDYKGTVGGVLSGDRNRLSHQELASRITGLTCITPGGEILKLGCNAVKDVAGYRIFPLLLGALGRLGLIAEVVFNTANILRDFSTGSFRPELFPLNYKWLDGEDIREKIIAQMDINGIFQE